jgi:4-diphosphocytidyl-2-C-methyl-D-erythritol kinase
VTVLTALAPAKVNLCLYLDGVRPSDGRHELVTVFESVSLCDRLSLSVGSSNDRVVCPGVDGPNLVASALTELRAAGWNGPPVSVAIDKRVPVAAGMGGGSADAAAALRLACALQPVADGTLAAIAAALGADVASQLAPGVSLGTGAGEVVRPLAPLAPHAYLILPATLPLATADVYREADRLRLPRSSQELAGARRELEEVLQDSGARLSESLIVNDLQPAAISLRPSIESALDEARGAGAEHAIVCGSGPTVAGLFWGPDARMRASAAATALEGRAGGAIAAVPVTPEVGAPQFEAQSRPDG